MRNFYWQQHNSVILLEVLQSTRCLWQIMAQLSNDQTSSYRVSHVVCVLSDLGKAHQFNSKQTEVRGAQQWHAAQ